MSRKKNSIGITGGIGSGKSFVCHLLEQRGIPVFYTDAEARKEMLENKFLQKQLSDLIGHPVMTTDGTLNKSQIAQYIAQGAHYAQKVNALVHPATRQRMRKWLSAQKQVVAVECALLYESGYNEDMDYVVAVTAPQEIRINRVMTRDGHNRDYVLRMMSLQMTDEEKAARADAVIINDGTRDVERQIDEILMKIKTI